MLGGGVILLWAAIRNLSISCLITSALQGKQGTCGKDATAVPPPGTPVPTGGA